MSIGFSASVKTQTIHGSAALPHAFHADTADCRLFANAHPDETAIRLHRYFIKPGEFRKPELIVENHRRSVRTGGIVVPRPNIRFQAKPDDV
jgi:hypothetical protein